MSVRSVRPLAGSLAELTALARQASDRSLTERQTARSLVTHRAADRSLA